MRPRAVAGLACACLVVSARALLPYHDWATLPVFYHSGNSSGPFSDEGLDFIVNHEFPMVTIEKGMASASAPAGTDAEAKIVAAAAAIKARAVKNGKRPPMTMFYLNSVMNWWMYDLARTIPEDLLVKLPNGKLARIVNQTVFDLTKNATRELWLNTIKTALASGSIDGVFADRGNYIVPSSWGIDPTAFQEGEFEMLRQCQELVDGTGVVIGNNQDIPGVHGRMFERWGYVPGDFDHLGPAADIQQMQAEPDAPTGPRAAEAHSGEPCNPANFNRSLAQFLVSAGDYAYYACTEGWSVTEGSNIWYPEYDKPLGAPTGPASKTTGSNGDVIYRRSFASGTNASFTLASANVLDSVGCICWSDGTVTGIPGCKCV